jgi:RNA polymerase sigma-70 factor (ECF subfamily)
MTPLAEATARFDQEVLPHLDAAYNLARWLLRNEQDAEDVVQEAMLRAFRFFAGFQGEQARPWLLKIVRNTCYTWLHRNRAKNADIEFEETLFGGDKQPNPEQRLLQSDARRQLKLALEALAPQFREVIVLRELEGMSYKEISEVAEIPCGTVMSRLSRARSELREALALMSSDFPVRGAGVGRQRDRQGETRPLGECVPSSSAALRG